MIHARKRFLSSSFKYFREPRIFSIRMKKRIPRFHNAARALFSCDALPRLLPSSSSPFSCSSVGQHGHSRQQLSNAFPTWLPISRCSRHLLKIYRSVLNGHGLFYAYGRNGPATSLSRGPRNFRRRFCVTSSVEQHESTRTLTDFYRNFVIQQSNRSHFEARRLYFDRLLSFKAVSALRIYTGNMIITYPFSRSCISIFENRESSNFFVIQTYHVLEDWNFFLYNEPFKIAVMWFFLAISLGFIKQCRDFLNSRKTRCLNIFVTFAKCQISCNFYVRFECLPTYS